MLSMHSDSPQPDDMPDEAATAPAPPRRRGWLAHVAALLWALLEAALFLPPVEMLVSFLALRSPRRALVAAAFALIGALLGSGILYLWGGRDAFTAMTLLSALPGLSEDIMIRAEEELLNSGAWSIFESVFSAAGGRAHAVFAQALGVGLPVFLGIYALARAARLLLAWALALGIASGLGTLLSRRQRQQQHLHVALVILWLLGWALLLWFLYGPAIPVLATDG